MIYEESRETPVIGAYDVVVCGGGPAGVSAALAAKSAASGILPSEVEYADVFGDPFVKTITESSLRGLTATVTVPATKVAVPEIGLSISPLKS